MEASTQETSLAVVAELEAEKNNEPIAAGSNEAISGIIASMAEYQPACELYDAHSFHGRLSERKKLLKVVEFGALSEKTPAIARLEHLDLTKDSAHEVAIRLQLAANKIRYECKQRFIIPEFEREIARLDEYIDRIKRIDVRLKAHDLSCELFLQRIKLKRIALAEAFDRAKQDDAPNAINLTRSPADLYAPIFDVRPQLAAENIVPFEEGSAV